VVWWATPVEVHSAFHRLARDRQLTRDELRQALARLEYLRTRWSEIQPTEEARHNAERLLAIHRLRAADAFQLAAAMVWCGNLTRGRVFIGGDSNLSDAAEAEGFTVIRLI
jgi:predicted nucleic acid-binding protein